MNQLGNPDMTVRKPLRIWIMRAEDVPEGVTTVVPTKIPGIVIVFEPLQEVRNEARRAD